MQFGILDTDGYGMYTSKTMDSPNMFKNWNLLLKLEVVWLSFVGTHLKI